MPTTAVQHFQEDIARARAIVIHANPLPPSTVPEQMLRSDLLRSAWMFGVGALDAYFERYGSIFQRRHDCIHNCDRPKVSPQALVKGGTVFKVIEDIEFLVSRCNEHINTEFRQFLRGTGCHPGIIAQAGY